MYNRDWPTVDDAMKFYAKRSPKSEGHHDPEPAAVREVFRGALQQARALKGACRRLMCMHSSCSMASVARPAALAALQDHLWKVKYVASPRQYSSTAAPVDHAVVSGLVLCDDVQVVMYNKGKKMFAFWFHTSFVENMNLEPYERARQGEQGCQGNRSTRRTSR